MPPQQQPPDRPQGRGRSRSRGGHAVEPERSVTAPLDPPMVPVAVAGTAIWAVAGLILLAAGAPDRWLWTCLAGFLFGLVLMVLMLLRDRRRRRGPT